MQQRAGVAEDGGRASARCATMPDQHRDSSRKSLRRGRQRGPKRRRMGLAAGRPAGFISSPTPRSLEIDARPDASDPVSEGMREGDAIALLGIEHTRRRNRANGLLRAASARRSASSSIRASATARNISSCAISPSSASRISLSPERSRRARARSGRARHDRGGGYILCGDLCRARRSSPGRRLASRQQSQLRSRCR